MELEKAKERVNNLGKSIQANCKGKSNIATSIETLLNELDKLEKETTNLKSYLSSQGMLNDYIRWKRRNEK